MSDTPAVNGPFATSEELAAALGSSDAEAKQAGTRLDRLGCGLAPVSETPRTDAGCFYAPTFDDGMQEVVTVDFSRQLERELIECWLECYALRAEVKRLNLTQRK